MKNSLKFKFFTAVMIVALLLVGCSSTKEESNNNQSEQQKDEQPIAVQGAMDVEVSALLEEMGDYKEEKHGNYTFYIGKIDDIPVVVSRTEIGMVHAAASTTLLIEKYQPKAIINQGTAGGHDPDLHVFDTVIGTEVMNIGSIRSEHLDDGEGMAPESWIFMTTGMRGYPPTSYDKKPCSEKSPQGFCFISCFCILKHICPSFVLL